MVVEVLMVTFVTCISLFLIAKGSDWATDSLLPVAKQLGTTKIAVALVLV